MIEIHVLNSLKVHATFGFRFVLLARVVQERALGAVEHEPALTPCLDAPAHLGHIAAARRLVHVDVLADGRVVAGALDVCLQVKVLAGVGQEPGQRS